MHPAFRSPRLLALAVAAWLPVCAVMAAFIHRTTDLGWKGCCGWVIPPMAIELFILLSTYSLCRWVPLFRRDWFRDLALLIGGAVASSAAWTGLIALYSGMLDHLFHVRQWQTAWQESWHVFFRLGILLFVGACLLHYLVLSVERAAQAERQADRDRLSASQAELRALRATIHPHFLFNSLTSLSTLTVVDPPRARRFCLDLAEFLRSSLRHEQRTQVTLGEELAHVDRYLAIEGVRLGDRLRVTRDIAPGMEQTPCPPVILLPLVGNAIKHGICARLEGGEIRISVRARENGVAVTVANPEPPAGTPAPEGEQLGLLTLRERLAHSTAGRARLDVRHTDGCFVAEIVLAGAADGSREERKDDPHPVG